MSIMEDYDGEVTSEFLLLHGTIDWWQFLLTNHPNRALKCGMADWYMKKVGDANREKALKLFEESANEGFEFAFFKLIEFYSKGELKDIDTAVYWLDQARKRGFDESRFSIMKSV